MPSQVVTGMGRLSYAYIFKADDDGKFRLNLIIDKKDKACLKKIEDAIAAARKIGYDKGLFKNGKGKDRPVTDLLSPLHDGDAKDDEEYQGAFYLTAKNTRKPAIVDKANDGDKDKDEMLTALDVYSGCYVRIGVDFWPYNNNSVGVGCTVNTIQKLKDGEAFGAAAVKAEDDFEDEATDEDDFG